MCFMYGMAYADTMLTRLEQEGSSKQLSERPRPPELQVPEDTPPPAHRLIRLQSDGRLLTQTPAKPARRRCAAASPSLCFRLQ